MKFLCAYLELVTPVSWFMSKFGPKTGTGDTQWLKYAVEDIPVVRPDLTIRTKFDAAVMDLLVMIDTDRDIKTVKKSQRDINGMVLDLYGFTSREASFLKRKN